MGGREKQVPKGLADLTSELLESLQVVRDACKGLRAGQRHHALALSGQLRGLLTDRAKNSVQLLQEVTGRLGHSPLIFAMPDVDEPLPISQSPVFLLKGPPFTLHRELPAQDEIPLSELTKHKLVSFEGQEYTVGAVIEHLANKAGGAHFSKSVPEGLGRLFASEVPQVFRYRDLILNALLQIGEIVYRVGMDSVRRVSDVHLLVDFAVLDPVGGEVVYDASYESLPMRMTVFLSDRRRVGVSLRGLGGSELSAQIDAVVDWSVSHTIYVGCTHDEDLRATLVVELDDGTLSERAVADCPVFLFNHLDEYVVTVNTAGDQRSEHSCLAIGQLGVLSRSTPVEVAKARAAFDRSSTDENRKVVHLMPGAAGRSAAGDRDLSMTGDVLHTTLAEALRWSRPLG